MTEEAYANQPKRRGFIRRLVPWLFFGGLIYAAVSYFILPPVAQVQLVQLVRNGYASSSSDIASVLNDAESNLKALEARLARLKEPAFTARVADILKRQEQAKSDIAAALGAVVPVPKKMDDIAAALSILNEAVASLEKNDKGSLEKQLQEAGVTVADIRARIDSIGTFNQRVGHMKKSVSELQREVVPFTKKDVGTVAQLISLQTDVSSIQTLVKTIQQGNPQKYDAKYDKNGLGDQLDALERMLLSLRKEVKVIADTTSRVRELQRTFGFPEPQPLAGNTR